MLQTIFYFFHVISKYFDSRGKLCKGKQLPQNNPSQTKSFFLVSELTLFPTRESMPVTQENLSLGLTDKLFPCFFMVLLMVFL